MNHFADRYTFEGQAGQRLVITMNSASPGLEAYVFLIGPDGLVTARDVFNGGGNSARIPASGSLTLPLTGRYVIEATSNGLQQTGNYSVNISLEGCVLTINPTSQHFASNGGTGTINITATGSNCGAAYLFSVWPTPTTWLLPKTLNGSGTQVMEFTVDPNPRVAGRGAFLIIGASFGAQMGGLSITITQSGSGPDCQLTPIAFGETVNGALSHTDCRSPIGGPDLVLADRYVFTATAGQQVAILSSIAANFTSQLTLIGPTGRILFTGTNAEFFHTRIPGGKGTLKLGMAGQYVIEVTAALPGIADPYALTLLNDAPPTLLSEESNDNAIALQSVSMLRDPFPLTTTFNLSADQQTRIMLIADNLAVLPGENQSAVAAIAEDNALNTYPLTVEFVGKVPGFGRLTQIVARLPSNLPQGQELRVKVTVRGKTSNNVRFRTKSP